MTTTATGIDSAVNALITAVQEAAKEAVREEVKGATIDLDRIEGFEDAVCDLIKDNMPRIDADDIRGLDDAPESAVGNYEFDACNIRHLNDAIDERLGEIDLKNRLGDALTDEVDTALEALLPDAIKEALDAREKPLDVKAVVADAIRTPEVQAVLQNEVRRALLAVIQGFLAGVIPVAPPVA